MDSNRDARPGQDAGRDSGPAQEVSAQAAAPAAPASSANPAPPGGSAQRIVVLAATLVVVLVALACGVLWGSDNVHIRLAEQAMLQQRAAEQGISQDDVPDVVGSDAGTVPGLDGPGASDDGGLPAPSSPASPSSAGDGQAPGPAAGDADNPEASAGSDLSPRIIRAPEK